MRGLTCAAIAIAAVIAATSAAQADGSLGKRIVGKTFCYDSGRKVTFNADGTMSNNFGKARNWSADKSGAGITYSGPGFSHTVPTTIDASGVLKETEPNGQIHSAKPC